MSFSQRHNTPVANFTYEIPKTHEFIKPSHLIVENGVDFVYPVKGMFINKKGAFGDELVIVTDTHLVNAPSYLVDTAKQIMSNEKDVQAINDGLVGFKFYEYTNKFGKQIAVEWIDVPAPVASENQEPNKSAVDVPF